jgi:hypothetical protein
MEVLTASDRRVSVSVWIQNTKSCHAQNIKNRVENDILPGFLFLALSIRMARPPDRSRQKRGFNFLSTLTRKMGQPSVQTDSTVNSTVNSTERLQCARFRRSAERSAERSENLIRGVQTL